MFNVAVLKMKDIKKYFIGISITILLIIAISKSFQKVDRKEEKIIEEVKNGVKTISENSLIGCMEDTMPIISNVNEEYKNIANEDDKIKDENILKEVLKSQVASIKMLDELEEPAETSTNSEKENEINKENESIQLTRRRVRNSGYDK